jgi:glucose/arabinose dehydrogenase/PKD repeat protein
MRSHRSRPIPVIAALARCRPAVRIAIAASALAASLSLLLPVLDARAADTPTFVQTQSREVNSGTTDSLAFNSANTAGNLIVAYVIWNNTGSVSLSDSRGNGYTSAAGRTAWGNGWSSQVFYAKGIVGGTNTVTATFANSINGWAVLYLHEYSGVDKVSPVDTTATATGSAAAMSSGSVTTTSPSDLLFAAGASSGTVTAGGSGYTTRSSAFGNRTMDRTVTATGAYSAAMTQDASSWVLHLLAFKANGSGTPSDTTPPTVSISAPANGASVKDILNVTADASDNVGVDHVQFQVDGTDVGSPDSDPPFALAWDTRSFPNGSHTLTARAFDAAGNSKLSAEVAVNVSNTSTFQNEILATGFDLPTAIKFLPDGRMLVAELQGKIKILPPPYTTPDPTPFLRLTNVGLAGVQQGIYDFLLDPNFNVNHYYYVFYTLGTPNRDRVSRFTANALLSGTVAGSEKVLYQDGQDANAEHHGGALTFGNDGKLYFTTGEHFDAAASQDLSSPRGKIHRINPDGTIPTDDPFYDGSGPHYDSIWALGLRNPWHAYYDSPTGRLFIGDVGGNDASTAIEEVNLGARGANYGWPNVEGPCSSPCTSPIYSYPHSGRDSAVAGGFVYHGTQFPSSYLGSYFFADYTRNFIKRLTLDSTGHVTGVYNFEPSDGHSDGPYGDIVYLIEGPDGALYYVDLGYSDISGTFGVSKIRRIRYISGNQAPIANASAEPTSGPSPLTVNFSSAGSSDPENDDLTYAWTFGDGDTSTAANPVHTYAHAGQYTARLSVSDGTSTTLSPLVSITVGSPPTATILTPQDGAIFRAGDVISFSGDGTDPDDGSLPASAYTWNIDFLHEGHVHPGVVQTGVKSGTFTIPTTGHDFSGNTRYRITLTVTDSNGLTDTKSVIIWPHKVNLSFAAAPSGLTLYVDGIAKTTPFVYDTLTRFQHTIEARNQSLGGSSYAFTSWSDGGAQTHTITAPETDQSYTATYHLASPATPTFVQVAAATPQTAMSTVSTIYPQAQVAGDLNAIVVGWNDSTGNVTSVTDSAGNTYQLGAPVVRGSGLSQAIYHAKNIAAAAAGANTVTVNFDKAVNYVDVRILEYGGLDRTNPLDVSKSAAGSASTANSGAATTTTARELILGAGMTTGVFSNAGSGFTKRIITTPDADIAEDRVVTATGSYSATAPQAGSWVMQMVTFRAAGQ